jgi:hypothetical protein
LEHPLFAADGSLLDLFVQRKDSKQFPVENPTETDEGKALPELVLVVEEETLRFVVWKMLQMQEMMLTAFGWRDRSPDTLPQPMQ